MLREVSLTVEAGEIFGVFGPSRSERTHLLRILSGTEKPTSGSIIFKSKNITSAGREARNFNYVSQDGASPLQRFLKSIRMPASDGANIALDIEKSVQEKPDLLLLDEVFCGMDGGVRERCFEMIKGFVRDGDRSVIVSTGSYEKVFEICDRVAVIIDGRVHQTGTPQAVYDAPSDASVAAIVGKNNIFYARRLTSTKAELPEFLTSDGQHRLFSRKAEIDTLGPINKNTPLMIRPESISITFGASFPEDNLLKATVTSIHPQGATTVVGLDANGLMLNALVPRLVGLDIGGECMISLPPDRVLVLKD
jgi:ABC-type Fe3+/spermidine/putrescine transport system ATPase subunit